MGSKATGVILVYICFHPCLWMIPKGISSLIMNACEWDWNNLRIRISMNLLEKARKPHPCFWLLLGIWRSLTRKDPFPCCPFLQCFFDVWECTFRKIMNHAHIRGIFQAHTYVIPKFKSTNFLFYLLPVVDSLCSSLTTFLFRLQATRSWILFLETVHISFRAGGGGLHHFGVSKMVWLRRLCLSRVFFPPKCLTDFCEMFTNMETRRWSWHMEPVANGYIDVWYQKPSWNKLLVRPYKGLATSRISNGTLGLASFGTYTKVIWVSVSGEDLWGRFFFCSNPQKLTACTVLMLQNSQSHLCSVIHGLEFVDILQKKWCSGFGIIASRGGEFFGRISEAWRPPSVKFGASMEARRSDQ